MPILTRTIILAAIVAAFAAAGVMASDEPQTVHAFSTLTQCDLVAVPGGNVPQDGGANPPVIFTIPAGVEVEVIPPGSIVRVGEIDWLPVAYAGEQGWLDAFGCLDFGYGTPDTGEPPVAGTPEPVYPLPVDDDDLRLVTTLPGTGTGETA